jgi:hypothetical protein
LRHSVSDPQTSDLQFFFSASSFYPGRKLDIPLSSTQNYNHNHAENDSNYGDTEVESEEEWLSVPQPLEPAAKNTFKTSHALANEVSTNLIFSL